MQINIFSEISNFSYGVIGKNLAIELNKNLEVCLAPNFHQLSGIEKSEIKELQKMIDRLNKIDFQNLGVMFANGNQMFKFSGKKKIGYIHFFSDEVEGTWINQLKQLDGVCVPSKWQQKILGKYSIKSEVIPIGVNIELFSYFKRYNNFDKTKKFKFFSIGKWDERKNQKLLIEAFCEEFSVEENVQLVCMWYNPFQRKNIINEVIGNLTNKHKLFTKETGNSASVVLLNPVNNLSELVNVYKNVNCGVFPYRAERTGLRLLESLATGMPCIATDYSATTEFINENNCYLLKNNKKISLKNSDSYKMLKGNWVDVEKEELKKQMRFVFENYEESLKKSENSMLELKKRFWWNSANKLTSYILNIIN